VRDEVEELRERMEANTMPEPNTGCWLWTGASNGPGTGGLKYGVVRWRGRQKMATHAAWFLAHGEWPSLCMCHRCDMPPCVNPEHLFHGTHAENMADMAKKGHLTGSRGEDHPCARLSVDDVRAVRRLCAEGQTYKSIAELFGVSVRTVRAIKARKIWRTVPEEVCQ